MEQTRVIQGTEELARGELDNVTLDGGGVALDQAGGRHLLYGCYTSPMLRLPAFDRLSVSWNADVPKGTVVEVQARAALAAGAPGCFGTAPSASPAKSPMCRATR